MPSLFPSLCASRQPQKNVFPERCLPRPGQIPPGNTNCAERSPLLLLPHSFPSFEALIVQYYNLKTPIIYFVLKRKMQPFFPPSLFSKAVRFLLETYCSIYTGEGERRGEARVSTMPGQS